MELRWSMGLGSTPPMFNLSSDHPYRDLRCERAGVQDESVSVFNGTVWLSLILVPDKKSDRQGSNRGRG